MRIARSLSAALIAALLAGCGNGAGSALVPTGSVPSTMQASSVASRGRVPVTITAQVGGRALLPNLRAAFSHGNGPKAAYARRPLANGTQVVVMATLWPSYATVQYNYWHGVLTLSKTGKITIPFLQATPANNQWLTVEVFADTAGHAGKYLGGLASIVNIPNKPAKPTIVVATPTSTLLFQTFIMMVANGLLDATDLKNPALSTTIAALAKSNGLIPDPTTGVYSKVALTNFVTAVAPSYARSVTINGGPTATQVSVANDYTDLPDTYAVYNAYGSIQDSFVPNLNGTFVTAVYGIPCWVSDSARRPGGRPAPDPKVCAATFPTGTGSITLPVFGGSLVVGAADYYAPFTGATQVVTGGVPGAKSTVTLTQVSTQVNLNTTDLQDWAFGTTPRGGITMYVDSKGIAIDQAPGILLESGIPGGYSQSSPAILLDSWNPWGLPLTNFDLCPILNVAGLPLGCQQYSPGMTLPLMTSFYDNGTNLAYYNWQGQNGTAIADNAGCSAYQITPSNNAFTITSTTPALFVPFLTQVSVRSKYCGGPGLLPAGTRVIVTATDSTGTQYSGGGTVQGTSGQTQVTLNSPIPFVSKSISITATLGAGAPAQIYVNGL